MTTAGHESPCYPSPVETLGIIMSQVNPRDSLIPACCSQRKRDLQNARSFRRSNQLVQNYFLIKEISSLSIRKGKFAEKFSIKIASQDIYQGSAKSLSRAPEDDMTYLLKTPSGDISTSIGESIEAKISRYSRMLAKSFTQSNECCNELSQSTSETHLEVKSRRIQVWKS
ncbi:hypothetical protein PoB_006454600 [Plakobranchus ocellatus]|uniref:Uncharacterized protein n=1 Tax=Plakobranchus ocellatus TaxID=259542 RepID=A0AAV4D211_9GAST|nr:hypothetical protein PoB_006454600 [Plakobranchus ocellatus]